MAREGPRVVLSPVEVLLAVNFPVPGETFLVEDVAAVHTADTGRVPGLLQDRQDVFVQDGFVTVGADHQHLARLMLARLPLDHLQHHKQLRISESEPLRRVENF